MTQTTALIVHELMSEPDRFRDNGNGSVSNGYYMVNMDGTRFGMGSASYAADGAERETLLKAVDFWKEQTGWVPPKTEDEIAAKEHRGRAVMTAETYSKSALEDFARAIRSHHKSYMVHKDATVLSKGIENAIMALDLLLRPISAMEGKPNRGQPGGIPSA